MAGGDGRLRAGAPPPAGRGPAGAPMTGRATADLERPPSALAGVRYGAVARHGDERGAFRELWRAVGVPGPRPPTETGAPAGDRAAVRPGQPVDVGGRRAARPPLPPPPARLLDRRDGPGVRRARRRPARARRRAGRAVVETRELAADDWVVIPTGVAHGFLALEPLELVYLVTNEYDGSDELGFAWDDPGRRRAVARRSGRRRMAARSCPSATSRTRRSRSWWRSLRG